MKKKYRIIVRKLRDDGSEKWCEEYVAVVDDAFDKDGQQTGKRNYRVYKADSEDDIRADFELSPVRDEASELETKAKDLKDYYRRDKPEITVVEIEVTATDKNTVRYQGMVRKKDSGGDVGYLHYYRFWISDSISESHPRYCLATGPIMMEVKRRVPIAKGMDEDAYLKQLMEEWHPDADEIELMIIERDENN